jgi:hypothetical protein
MNIEIKKQRDSLKALSAQIEKHMWNKGIPYSNYYHQFHYESRVSSSKKHQYHQAMERALIDARNKAEQNTDKTNKGEVKVSFYEEWKIKFYIITEWVVEDWALRHNLKYLDHNIKNPFSPEDCKINEVDIDVKTTIGLGRLKAIPFHSRTKDSKEIQIAVKSECFNPRSPYYTQHNILGIFDPSRYRDINAPLKYLPIFTQVKNACYFQPLEEYFDVLPNINGKIIDYNQEVIDSWIKIDSLPKQKNYEVNYNLITIIFLMLDYPVRLNAFLKKQLPAIHHDFIPVIIELAAKKSIQLLPHYLTDYLIKKIYNKEEIDQKSIVHIMFSICFPNVSQRLYIENLFKLLEIIPDVCCKWHPEESIKDMELRYIEGDIPTFQAQCPQDPSKRTTIYTYSWKTYETLFYKKNLQCKDNNCGGLTHEWFDYDEESKKYKTICKSTCVLHGREAFNKTKEEELIKFKNNETIYPDDVPF